MRKPHRTTLLLRLGIAALLLVGAARTTLFTVYRVAGTSMLDTLADGDRILVSDVPWLTGQPGLGDTVVLSVDGEVLVKRVVAGPGDRIAMRRGRLLRNGEPVTEAIPQRYRSLEDWPEARMAGNELFVLGDNRRVSVDSREFGPVSLGQVLGRVVLRLAPSGLSTVAALERL